MSGTRSRPISNSDRRPNDLASLEIIDPGHYAEHGYPHAAWARLRREAPIHRCERWAPLPFWAVTTHRDIVEISRQPTLFANGPRTEIVSAAEAPQIHGLITIDPPEHGRFRKLVSSRFTSRALGPLRRQLDAVADAVLDAVAGNETTRNATSGGLLAFLENPGEWQRLRRDPSLLPGAMEEVLRWTSPVVHFARTATADCELRGQKLRAGDSLALFYASANRDEEVFGDPFTFRIDRHPNHHLALGVGEHVCLGAHVARLELRAIFTRLLQHLASAELAGPVERLRSSTVGGLKRMPIRYQLARGSAVRG